MDKMKQRSKYNFQKTLQQKSISTNLTLIKNLEKTLALFYSFVYL